MEVKDFVVENGQMYYKKKALYRQPLFWSTIVGLVLSFVLGVTCLILMTSLASSEATDDWSSESYFDNSIVYTEYQVGDSVDFSDGLQITVTSMGKDDSLTLVDDYYNFAYLVEMEVKNPTEEVVYFDEYYFQLVDAGTVIPYDLDMRTYDVNLPEKVNPGETIKVKLVYGVDQIDNLAFVYEDVMWTELIGEGI
ncbi:DUF4352 domain-containing protein [Streptococcus suis]|uniref:DUF4352 domain-containing protein n=1 Tax=Streptococcus suis TaxID=1307 RepID=UPI000CF38573|nr:DUF4352 domain-containing protein [Streptococcus suis]MBY4985033.1 DUF4352 domain-containing protein [Streptococcus suis]MBY5038158.1 DUF4352 domain-containing protein [Streptococcus suis]MDW8758434.1 DUF4352 domain-containing protein [Streptococcus suis]HEM5989376.1 DUF4352 domain-containing protein [Streptococcus suis]HEM5996697.1 DUF4352 domain-containing protein [Streptococcus suis]